MMEELQKSPIDTVKVNFRLNFNLLFMGRLLSVMGSSVFSFALSLYILDTTGSAAAFSAILSASILPGALVNGLCGVFVDRHNRKRIMIVSDLLTGALVLALLAAFQINQKDIALLAVYCLTVSGIQGFFNLAFNASIPNIVEKESVAKANSLFQALNAVVNVAGPVIGAFFYKALGIEMVMLVDALSFIASGLCSAYLKFFSGNARGDAALDSEKYLDGLKAIFSYLNRNKIIRFLFAFAVVANFIYLPLLMLGIPFVNYNIIKVSGFQLSIIQASSAAGVILGAVLVSSRKANNQYLRKFFVLLFAQGVIFILWGFPQLPALINVDRWIITIIFSLLLLLLSTLNTIQMVPMVSHFQVQIPDEIRGRMMGFFYSALLTSAPLGMWLYGLLLGRAPWAYVTVASGICLSILCFIGSRNNHFTRFMKDLDGTSTNQPSGVQEATSL